MNSFSFQFSRLFLLFLDVFTLAFCVYISFCFSSLSLLYNQFFASSREDVTILMEVKKEYGKGLQRTNNYQYMAQCMYELIKAGGGGVGGLCNFAL
jgi:hypothetical protein